MGYKLKVVVLASIALSFAVGAVLGARWQDRHYRSTVTMDEARALTWSRFVIECQRMRGVTQSCYEEATRKVPVVAVNGTAIIEPGGSVGHVND
jgi:hypothetical protein